MAGYLDTLEWDFPSNDVQRKARVIINLADRLSWLETEIANSGGKNDFTASENLDYELFGVLPKFENLHLERLQKEKLRTKDLIYIEELKIKALAISNITERKFFLIDEQSQFIYDKELHEVGIGGYRNNLPDWIVPDKDGKGDGFSEEFVRRFLDGVKEGIPHLTNAFSEYYNNGIGINYFKIKDIAALIGELIDEVQNLPVIVPDQSRGNLVNLQIAEVAILHVYLSKFGGRPVTLLNCTEIAKKYGIDKPTSSKKVYYEFEKYKQDSERLKIHTSNKTAAKFHIKRFEKLLPILKLENLNAAKAAESDLVNLKKSFEKYH